MAERLDRLGFYMTETMKSVSLGDVSTVITSGSRGWARYYASDGSPFIRMANLRRDGIDLNLEDLRHVSLPKNSVEAKRTKLKKGDILVSITAELGKTGLVRNVFDRDAFISQHVCLIRIESPEIDNEYAAYFLSSEPERRRLNRLNDAGAKAGLNLQTIARYRLTFPPLSEQHKIAEILRTWDEAIEKLEALRAAKLRQYSALARRFFDPCHPTFQPRPDAWREFDLGEVFCERTQTGEEGDTLLSITMSEGVIDRDDVGRKDTSNEDKSRYKLILPGDLGYNTMRMWQGVSGLSTLRGIVSPAYTIVTPDNRNIAARYAAHLFKSRRVVFDFQRYSQGLTSDTWNLKFPAFSKIKIFLPPIEQQEKQAELLDMTKGEIAAVERQSKTLTRQRRGLMQKLLTGEWRVSVHPNYASYEPNEKSDLFKKE